MSLACAAFGIRPRTFRHRRAKAVKAAALAASEDGGSANDRASGETSAANGSESTAGPSSEANARPGLDSEINNETSNKAESETSSEAGNEAGSGTGSEAGSEPSSETSSEAKAATESASANRPARKPHPAALTAGEKLLILNTLCSERYYDQPPAQVFNSLLDDGVYLCSVRQMYRLLEDHGLNKERRRGGHSRRGLHEEPIVHATKPNQAWSWDITKLKGPESGVLYYLYAIIDLYSRYVVGWAVHASETTALATKLIRACVEREGVNAGELTLHADRGSPMTANDMIALLDELGVKRSHSRPRVSNDNPFSEAHFKTVKYHADYPDRFGSLQDARAWCREFFAWYNHVHYHSGIGYLHPATLHAGRQEEIITARQATLDEARAKHPHRFQQRPTPPRPPEEVWINPPVIYTA